MTDRPHSHRLRALDGMRALAVGAVVVFHSTHVLRGGSIGVDIFFVLSGFLITRLLLDEHSASGDISRRRFYMRRWLRLAPALVSAVVLTSLLVAFDAPVRHAVTGSGGYPGAVVAALTYTTDIYLPLTHAVNPLSHTWSLAVEEQFYLVWPFALLAALVRWRDRMPTVLAVAFVVALAVQIVSSATIGGGWVAFTPLGHASELIAGALLASLYPLAVKLPWALVGLAGIAAYSLVGVSGSADLGLALPGMTVCTFLVIAHVTSQESFVTRALSLRPLVWIGLISYGIYLYHFPVIWFVGPLSLHHGMSAVVVGVLSVTLAAASYRWIEKPFLRRKRRYEPTRSLESLQIRSTPDEGSDRTG